MKRIIPLLIMAVLLLPACEDFLTKDPKGVMTEEKYYLSPDAGFKAVTKCYQTMNDFYGYEVPRVELGNISTDDCERGGSDFADRPFLTDLSFGRPLPNNETLTYLWSTLYKGIGNCNACLENIPNTALIDAAGYPVDDATKARYVAEVRFLRAFFYFDLVKIFGGVPIVERTLTQADVPDIYRATEAQTAEFVMNELEAVAQDVNLPSRSVLPANELGRITKEIAWAMQARVYMYFAKDDTSLYTKARDAAYKVIESNTADLAPDFQSLYLPECYKLSESIFPNIRGDDPGQNIYGSHIPIYSSPRGPTGAWGLDQPTQNLVDEFEEGDPRLLFTITQPGDVFPKNSGTETLDFSTYPNTGYHSRKPYMIEARRGLGWGDDAWSFHIIRYADVLLMYAEALFQTGGDRNEVAGYINQVRHRANNSRHDDVEAVSRVLVIPAIDIPDVLASDDLFEAIKHERRVELAGEYNRLYDLKRWNIYVQTMNAFSLLPSANGRGADFTLGVNELFPIPQVEIDRTQGGITQNPGY